MRARHIFACCTLLFAGAAAHFSTCEITRHERLQYLDRHEVGLECSNINTPMNYVKLVGCNDRDSKYMRYEYTCSSSGGTGYKPSEWRYTQCNVMRDHRNEYLDRQDVYCPHSWALTEFDVTSSGCGGNDMRYRYKCVEMDLHKWRWTESSCEKLWDENNEYLDRVKTLQLVELRRSLPLFQVQDQLRKRCSCLTSAQPSTAQPATSLLPASFSSSPFTFSPTSSLHRLPTSPLTQSPPPSAPPPSPPPSPSPPPPSRHH
ncbi:hypothetical protein CYMTET_30179 [Cymbomonas tetramitiformis]|uniref:Uncharacterized protein n=1 Tax=Cymbomonas tetramitiformis TaxID=36881 RepID=A0AAE0FKX3_9CHLO|nr:hypothetical protein CYMTET_30179 [Cymbomonas tetramitiformis]